MSALAHGGSDTGSNLIDWHLEYAEDGVPPVPGSNHREGHRRGHSRQRRSARM